MNNNGNVGSDGKKPKWVPSGLKNMRGVVYESSNCITCEKNCLIHLRISASVELPETCILENVSGIPPNDVKEENLLVSKGG